MKYCENGSMAMQYSHPFDFKNWPTFPKPRSDGNAAARRVTCWLFKRRIRSDGRESLSISGSSMVVERITKQTSTPRFTNSLICSIACNSAPAVTNEGSTKQIFGGVLFTVLSIREFVIAPKL